MYRLRKLRVESLRVIERVASKIAPGRVPSFLEAHVIKVIETIGAEEAIGRVRLSKILSLGEGATRTLVRHLVREGMIGVSRSGMVLSKFGEKVFSDLRSRISEEIEIPKSPITVARFNVAILVRKAARLVKFGVEQRDAAIKVGASGATTLIFRNDKLTIRGMSEDVFKDIQPIRDTLISELKPRENDVVIIGSAEDKLSAEFGAKTAAFELLKSEKL